MNLDGTYIGTFTDLMSEGFIVIDRAGVIQVYNRRAREIFKINYRLDGQHRAGRLEEGDLVIIGDSSFGRDDGRLGREDLRVLGLEDIDISRDDALLAIGTYRQAGARYKIIAGEDKEGCHSLEWGDLACEIDFSQKRIDIRVASKHYPMTYKKYIGHMVVLDGASREIKFFQHQGYTARGECIGDILAGGSYLAKGGEDQGLEVLGRKISQIHKSDYIIEKLLEVANDRGQEEHYIAEEINGISTLCSVYKVRSGQEVVGAALKLEDITELENISREQNQVCERLRQAEEELLLEGRLQESFPNFVGSSREIRQVKKLALKAAGTRSNVLILGRSGTGKSELARLIHKNSGLGEGPFVEVNCGAIAENLLEAELFGYEDGAFTGARPGGREGFFKKANRGTIFLDEIGDLPKNLQVKLLRTIQDKVFYPVGSSNQVQLDLRIITATNKNLEEEILAGNFREDLYYRINVFPIYIPGLAQRREDIYDLVELILPRLSRELGLEEKLLSSEAMNKLLAHSWPGNIRELENVLERAISLADSRTILSKDIGLYQEGPVQAASFKEEVEACEREIIRRRIQAHGGRKQEAMESLDMSRSNFYKKLRDYNIT